jgi:hypothetical protein
MYTVKKTIQCTDVGDMYTDKGLYSACTEVVGMYFDKGPYSAPRPAACTLIKVRTVHLGRRHVH